MNRTFVVGDVHGGAKALQQCLERSNFQEEDTLISLGDICDGWKETYECVEILLGIKNLIAIRGNHDQWFYEFIRTGIHGSDWNQGADRTKESYGKRSMMIPESHEKFFGTQMNYYIDDQNRCFVHGGFNRHYDIKEQNFPYIYYWDRDLWDQALSYEAMSEEYKQKYKFEMENDFFEIYIGHTTTQFWNKIQYMKAANIYNVDCGAGGNGRLCMLNIDTKEAYYSDNMYDLYPGEKGRW